MNDMFPNQLNVLKCCCPNTNESLVSMNKSKEIYANNGLPGRNVTIEIWKDGNLLIRFLEKEIVFSVEEDILVLSL